MKALACVLFLVLPLGAQSLSGRRAPSFSLPDTALTQHDLLDYRGKWLLLDFMKTDCPHCVTLSRVLEQVKKQFGTARVDVLSIVISPPENTNTVAKYTLENKLTSPIVFDQGQVAVSYFKATPTNPAFDTPHLFVINPAGSIVKDWMESDPNTPIHDGKALAAALETLMAGK